MVRKKKYNRYSKIEQYFEKYIQSTPLMFLGMMVIFLVIMIFATINSVYKGDYIQKETFTVGNPVLDMVPELLPIEHDFEPIELPLKKQDGDVLHGLGKIRDITCSHDGNLVAVWAGHGLFIWNLNISKIQPIYWFDDIFDKNDYPQMAFSSDQKYFAIGIQNGLIYLWDAKTWEPIYAFKPYPRHAIYKIAFSPDSQMLATGGSGNMVRLWDFQNIQLKKVFNERGKIKDIDFSPDSKSILITSDHMNLRDIASRKIIKSPTRAVTVSNAAIDDKFIYYAESGSLRRMPLFAQQFDEYFNFNEMYTLPERPKNLTPREILSRPIDYYPSGPLSIPIESVGVLPESNYFYTGAVDGKIRLWDKDTLKNVITIQTFLHRPKLHNNNIYYPLYTPALFPQGKNNVIVASRRQGTIEVWDLEQHKCLYELPGYHPSIRNYELLSDDSTLLIVYTNGSFELKDINTGKVLLRINEVDADVSDVVVSPSQQYAAVILGSGGIKVIDLETKYCIQEFSDQEEYFTSAIFSSNEKYLISANGYLEGKREQPYLEIKWFEIPSGELIKTYQLETVGRMYNDILNHEKTRYAVSLYLLPENNRLLINSGAIYCPQIWDTAADNLVSEIDDIINLLAVMSDMQKVICHDRDNKTVDVLEIPSGKLIDRYENQNFATFIDLAKYNQDQTLFLILDSKNQLFIYDTTTKEVVYQFQFDKPVSFINLSDNNRSLYIGTYDGSYTKTIDIAHQN